MMRIIYYSYKGIKNFRFENDNCPKYADTSYIIQYYILYNITRYMY